MSHFISIISGIFINLWGFMWFGHGNTITIWHQMTAVGRAKRHTPEQVKLDLYCLPAIHRYNILQMGTVPALAVTGGPSSFENEQNCFGAEGEKERGHGKQRKDNETGWVKGRGFRVLTACESSKHIRPTEIKPASFGHPGESLWGRYITTASTRH